jgi:hypothetical protein
MEKRSQDIALVGAILLSIVGITHTAAAGDGSVRFISAGPVRLGDGHVSHMRTFLPLTSRPIQVQFFGAGGALLKTLEVQPPTSSSGPFFEVFFEASFVPDPARTMPGRMTIIDADGTMVHTGDSDGTIAIVVGTPHGGGFGTMQIVDGAGETVGIVPYLTYRLKR